jgi:uncharacterized protein (TIGR04141 family)
MSVIILYAIIGVLVVAVLCLTVKVCIMRPLYFSADQCEEYLDKLIKSHMIQTLEPFTMENSSVKVGGKIRNTETAYNKHVADERGFLLLDCNTRKTSGIEIADLYDTKNHIFYHIKKIGDLRVLSMQVINSCLYITSPGNRDIIMELLNHNLGNFSYVFGIILNPGQGREFNLPLKDKLALYIAIKVLVSRGIKYKIEFIDSAV